MHFVLKNNFQRKFDIKLEKRSAAIFLMNVTFATPRKFFLFIYLVCRNTQYALLH